MRRDLDYRSSRLGSSPYCDDDSRSSPHCDVYPPESNGCVRGGLWTGSGYDDDVRIRLGRIRLRNRRTVLCPLWTVPHHSCIPLPQTRLPVEGTVLSEVSPNRADKVMLFFLS